MPRTAELSERLQRAHVEAYVALSAEVRPLPGACELLTHLTALGVSWAIATSGRREAASATIDMLGVPSGVPIVTRDLDEVGIRR